MEEQKQFIYQQVNLGSLPFYEKQQPQMTPKINCPFGKLADLICCTHQCSNPAFMCSSTECKCRNQLHKMCCFFQSKPVLEKLYSYKINAKIQQQYKKSINSIYKKVSNVYDKMIDYLSNLKDKSLYKIRYYHLGNKQIELKKLIDDKKFQKIDGQLVMQIMKQNKFSYYREPNQVLFLQNFYQEEIQSTLEALVKQIDKKIFRFSSSIIQTKGQFEILQGILNSQGKKYKLQYRASIQNFSVQSFHQRCDYLPNSVVLLKTQFGKTIGGYTKLNWHGYGYMKDLLKDSFIFSVTQNRKFYLVNQNQAIYRSQQYGPCFGRDINIGRKNRESKFNFPSSYDDKQQSLQSSQATTKMFIGAEQQKFARIEEWEVFTLQSRDQSQVVYQKEKGQIRRRRARRSSTPSQSQQRPRSGSSSRSRNNTP